MKNLIQNIVKQLEDIQRGKIWIGSNFEKIIDSINPKFIFIRPSSDLHSIAEIISHLTIWRKDTILKIKTGKGEINDDDKKTWINNDVLKEIGWKKIWSGYNNTLIELIDLLNELDDNFLNKKYFDTDYKDYYTYEFVIYGMIHHDLYHLGQLGLIIKILNKNHC